MKTDRELLELAAKAAGIYLEWDGPPSQWVPIYYEGKTYHSWNPLEDDGDALRLAVKLKISVHFGTYKVAAEASPSEDFGNDIYATEGYDSDDFAATRRAIVRTAAAIGEGME